MFGKNDKPEYEQQEPQDDVLLELWREKGVSAEEQLIAQDNRDQDMQEDELGSARDD